MKQVIFAIFLLAGVIGAYPAQARAADNPVHAVLLIDRTPLPAGSDANLAVDIQIDPGYHIHSNHPYEENLIATSVTPQPAAGIAFQPVRFPQAQDLPVSPVLSPLGKLSAYTGHVTILIPLRISADAVPGPLTLDVKLLYQSCNDHQCLLPQKETLSIPVTVAPAGATVQMLNPAVFDFASQQIFANVTPSAAATSPATSAVESLPEVPVTTVSPSNLTNEKSELALLNARDYHVAAPPLPLWKLVLLSLLGGAILNVMPCVLPVIPLKVLGLVQQAHGDRKLAVLHGLVFSAGIITLFGTLAIIFAIIRLVTHQEALYGMQFQSPVFLVAMGLIVLALALSMLGVWTINPPQALYKIEQPHTGYMGSFSTGLLATLLATPCSAPYLGPVLAYALAQRLPIMFGTMALIGIGMSLPYVILAAFPAGLNKLPRAGRWSELLKQGLGIFMIGVSVYLLMLISNPGYWPYAFAGALLVAAVCWAWGQIPTLNMEPKKIWSIRVAAVLIGAGVGWIIYRQSRGVPAMANQPIIAGTPVTTGIPASALQEAAAMPLNWQPFSLHALDAALAAGQPVMVDWTANWCINCRYVEATVLDTAAMRQAVTEHHVLLLRADLSNDAPVAQLLLTKLDSHSIPFLAIFSPVMPLSPTTFRDIYGKTEVITALEKTEK